MRRAGGRRGHLGLSALLVFLLVSALSSAVGGGLAVSASSPAASPAAGPAAQAVDWDDICSRSAFNADGHAEQVMDGWLVIAPFARVKIGTTGNVNWKLDPYEHPSWTASFNGLRWVDKLVDRGQRPGGEPYLDRARDIIRDWLADNPPNTANPPSYTWGSPTSVSTRSDTLVCAADAFAGEAWFDQAVADHARALVSRWSGAWNHGLMEALALLRLGCGTGHAPWGDLARDRMVASFEPNRLGPAIDAEGAPNEQTTGYVTLIYRLWVKAWVLLEKCGYAIPPVVADRPARIPEFMAQSTQPNGRVVQIGDTYANPPAAVEGTVAEYAATRGEAGPTPTRNVVAYPAGYVFGRSGWGTQRSFGSESFYSLRFGPGRQVHGHFDHQSLTYYARGQELLTDSGHTGFKSDAYRTYLLSAQAHNRLVIPSAKFRHAVTTELRRKSVRPDGQFYELTNESFRDIPITRSVYVSQRPDLAVVFDRTARTSTRTFTQLWHLDPSLAVTGVSRSSATAVSNSGNVRLTVARVALPGQQIPVGATRVVKGQTNPYQGWVSRQKLQRTRAPVVTMAARGTSARMLTVIAPSSRGTSVRPSVTQGPNGSYRLSVRIGRTVHRFTVGSGGMISRG